MKLEYAAMPETMFEQEDRLTAAGLQDIYELLAVAHDDAPIVHLSYDKEKRVDRLEDGVWIRKGSYRLKHGSFIDPSDLAVYGGQYYEADATGSHEALEVNWKAPKPEGACAIPNVAALRQWIEETFGDNEEPAEAQEIKLLQPDSRFEFHGKLTKTWHIIVFQGDDENATELIAFE